MDGTLSGSLFDLGLILQVVKHRDVNQVPELHLGDFVKDAVDENTCMA